MAACIIGTGGGYYAAASNPFNLASVDGEAATLATIDTAAPGAVGRRTLAGDYLSSIFAQQHHDWTQAGEYLGNVILNSPDDPELIKRAMVLAMGAGDVQKALLLAKRSVDDKDHDALAELFLSIGALHEKNYRQAADGIKKMPSGSLSEFVMPLLESWSKAGIGDFYVERLQTNTIHLHHAILIADFLGKPAPFENVLDKISAKDTLSTDDLERIGDIYVHLNEPGKAVAVFQKALIQWPQHPAISKKLAALKEGKKLDPIKKVGTPEQGVALALYDMANILFSQYADDSAQVFVQMALYLAPDLTDARLLLAAIDTRNQRYRQAIETYRTISPGDDYFLDARRRAADLLEETKDTDGALAELNSLVNEHNDIESLIKIGNIYRNKEDFKKAVGIYNEAAAKLGGIPPEYWNLYYVRGMSYERLGQWDKAEADLKAALALEPDHPFLLNYLGYAWADQGKNLDEALKLLQKAAALQPEDGYITDSLGWVLYKMGRYTESLEHLEKAVELMPYDPVVNDHLGDAYWQAGRKREARFQWQRAVNFSKDEAMIAAITAKIDNGLPAGRVVQQAESHAGSDTATP